MHTTIKNILGAAIIISALVGSMSLSRMSSAYSRSIDPAKTRNFAVTGESSVVIVPNIAEFTFGVTTQGGRDLAELQKENIRKLNDAITYVKSQNVAAKDITTSHYQVEPRYQYFPCTTGVCQPPQIVGYTIVQRVIVKVRDFSAAGRILAGVVERGVNDVSQLHFTIDDIETIRTAARIEAIGKAREKAKAIAAAAGVTADEIISIEDSSTSADYSEMQFNMPRSTGASFDAKSTGPTPYVEPGSQEVRMRVTLRYAIHE
jgi:uncharacterized protein